MSRQGPTFVLDEELEEASASLHLRGFRAPARHYGSPVEKSQRDDGAEAGSIDSTEGRSRGVREKSSQPANGVDPAEPWCNCR